MIRAESGLRPSTFTPLDVDAKLVWSVKKTSAQVQFSRAEGEKRNTLTSRDKNSPAQIERQFVVGHLDRDAGSSNGVSASADLEQDRRLSIESHCLKRSSRDQPG